MTDLLCVVDAGSSALKTVLFDARGGLAGLASRPVPTDIRPDRSVAQDPHDWWRALKGCLTDLPAAQRAGIAALAFTGSMQNLIPLDGQGAPLGPAVLYSDRRLTETEVAALVGRLPADYAQRTGNRPDPAHVIVRLMAPTRFLKAPDQLGTVLFGAKDALIARLSGRRVVDPTTAATTGLFNLRAGAWDETLIAAADLSPSLLPDILPGDAIVGPLLPDVASELGLSPDVPVYNGAGDGAAATWGADAGTPGVAYVYLGTTGWIAATLPMAQADPPRDIYTLADPVHRDRAIVIAPFLAAGASLDWLAATLGHGVDDLMARAQEGEGAPLFLPYLMGERSPFDDQGVRGAFLGLDRAHGPGALARAVLEGVAFATRHNLEAAGLEPGPLTVIGGGARGPAQVQALADALGQPMRVPSASRETPALGICRMIAPKLGFAVPAAGEDSIVVAPRPQAVPVLERRYRLYLRSAAFVRDLARDGLTDNPVQV